MRGIVLLAPGSRDPQWARPFEALREGVRRQRPEYPIALACLEDGSPTLEQAVAMLVDEGAAAITVFPLFLGQDGPLREHLPRLLEPIRAACRHVPIGVEPALGEVPEVIAAIAGWILERAD